MKLPSLSARGLNVADQLAAEERDWGALYELARARDTGSYKLLTPAHDSAAEAPTVKCPRLGVSNA